MGRRLKANEPTMIEGGRLTAPGWSPDDAKYDSEIPNHPVSESWQALSHVAGSLIIAEDVAELPGFELPK